MALTREQVKHIATLARVGMTEADLERFGHQLSQILEHFQVLNQVDTSNVPPTSHSVDVASVMRNDGVKPSFPADDVLANAPKREEGFFRVMAVLEQ